jgi:hypothetical protein
MDSEKSMFFVFGQKVKKWWILCEQFRKAVEHVEATNGRLLVCILKRFAVRCEMKRKNKW